MDDKDKKILIERVREAFEQRFPNTNADFKEYIECFVSFVVKETIKQIDQNNEKPN